MKKILPAIFLGLIATACTQTGMNNKYPTQQKASKEVKNIIMVVADGMGPAYTSAYRYYSDDPNTESIEQTVFDRHLVGSATTYPARVSGYVTDSAAAATALASGVKTYNNAIGVDVNKNPVKSVLQRAKRQGKKTGVVVTSQVNHATPASYISHNEYRRNYNAIADSYIDNGINTDVLLGGGTQYFVREDRNLVDEYKKANFHYIEEYSALNSLPDDKPILGLFAEVGLPWALDDVNSERLSLMTKAAINQLENEQGYFLLVEASQVDWAGHSNDINSAMAEMKDLAVTIEYLENYVSMNPDTLVVLTADHSTGGFTIAANGLYEWRPDVLRKMTQSTKNIAKELMNTKISTESLNAYLPFNVSQTEVDTLKQLKANKNILEKPKVINALYKALNRLIDKQTNTGWTSSGHTAVDVPVFAIGPQKELFSGSIDNTDIAKNIFKLLGK